MSATKRLLAALVAVVGLIIAAASMGAAASAYPPGTNPTISTSASTVAPGGSLTVSGSNFSPNAEVDLSLHSTPVSLGAVTTDGNGAFAASITIPSGTADGAHTIEALDTPTGDVATAAITVDSSVVVTPPGTGGGSPIGAGGVAVIGIGALGVVLLVGGGLMLMAGRRRKVIA